MNDAITETMFSNAVRDLGTAQALVKQYLADPSVSSIGVTAAPLRQAVENLRVVQETLTGLAKRL